MNEKITNTSKENQTADFTIWESQFDNSSDESLPTGDAALEAARNRNETHNDTERDLAVDTPSQTIETQTNRIANMSDFVPYSDLSQEQAVHEINELFGNDQPATDHEAPAESTNSEYDSRVASSANRASEKLSAFAERYDKEGPQLLARKALRRIGRALASPVRYTASALGEKVSSAASSAKEALKPYVSPVEERVKLYEKQPEEPEAQSAVEATTEAGDEADNQEFYSKKSAKALDWIGEKVEGNGGTVREFVAEKFYDKAVTVDDREGTYASRAGDKVRRGIDAMDKRSRENDGWLRDKIAEKYTEAKDRRKNRVKRQRIRTVGRKLIAYHRAGRDAAKNVKRNDHQNTFDLVG